MTRKLAPFYVWPADPKWDRLIGTLHTADIVILNPQSGNIESAEVAGERPLWAALCARVAATGARPVIYQPVHWGDADTHLIEARIRRAREWMSIRGVFFDEAPQHWSTQIEPRLLRLHGAARAPGRTGLSIWNAGTRIDRRLAHLPGSIWVTCEATWADALPPQPGINGSRQAVIVHDAPPGAPAPAGYGYAWSTADHDYDEDPST